MKIILLVLGKTEEQYLREGITLYEKRIKHYVPFEIKTLVAAGNLNPEDQKKREEEQLSKNADILTADLIIYLDERGSPYNSREFAGYMQKLFNRGMKKIIFVIGGPHGFSDKILARENAKISLSPLTFSHQMVRLVFVEQLYRAMTILRGEKYHH